MANYTYFKVNILDNGVAVAHLDNPTEKLNTISSKMTGDMEILLAEVEKNDNIKALVWVSAKPDNFIAGADITELSAIEKPEDGERIIAGAHKIFNRMEALEKPVVAAIHGACLGGGLEFALSCHYRIVTDSPKTQLGLPEVKLGILPAGGGTQRLPRLVGLQQGLDMILTGKTVRAQQARKLGIADDVVVPFDLEKQAVQAVLRLLSEPAKASGRKRGLTDQVIEDFAPARNFAFSKAEEMVRKQTKGNYPAPFAILDCVRTGFEKGMEAGLQKEREHFGQLITTDVCEELMRLFFAMTSKKKMPQAKDAPKVRKAAVLGAGLMGAGIASVSANKAKTPVLLKDINFEAVARGIKSIFRDVDKLHRKKAISRLERDRIVNMVVGATDYDGFGDVDIVIEAVFEELSIKRKVLADTEAATSKDCIFASNTSALPIHKIAEKAKRPENVIGMHYFSPVPAMPLLEIIKAEKTSERAEKIAVAFGLAQGKTVIVVKDGPGFYTTRILAPLLNETGLLLAEGATIEQIDGAMTAWGYPVGPVRLIDEVGIDVAAHVAKDLGGSLFAGRGVPQSDGVVKMAEAGLLGHKNGRGFYLYDVEVNTGLPLFGAKKKKRIPNDEVYQYFNGERKEIDAYDIQLRNALVQVNEAALCLQEEIIASPLDGDLGAILGLGFPPFRGGPFRFLDRFGVGVAVDKLKEFREKHGAQFEPAQILVDYAKKNKRFYK